MRVLDLFSGIGGFSLGLERAGMRTVAFCEIDPYARKVLAKHWPGDCEDNRMNKVLKTSVFGIPLDSLPARFIDCVIAEDYTPILEWRKELHRIGATEQTLANPLPVVVAGYRVRTNERP